MSKRARMSLRLKPDEAAVVASLDFWERLEEWFIYSADEFPEESDGWLAAAEHVREWVNLTRYETQTDRSEA